MFARLVSLCAIAFFAGCASAPPMMTAPQQTVGPAPAGSAQIVFMRDSFVGSAISASLFDVTSGTPEFLGIIQNGTKLAHQTTPGKHTYMVVSEAADYLEADLSAGLTYYSLITPRMGAWKARFSLWPVKANPNAEYSQSSSDFAKWRDDTKLVRNSSEAQAWFASNRESIVQKHQKYWPSWQQKSPADLAKRTLVPADGTR